MKLWDKAQQKIKNLIETTESSLHDRKWLDEKRSEIESYLNKAMSEQLTITKTDLYKIIKGKVKQKSENTALDYLLAEFLEEHKTNDGLSIKENTIKKYKSLIRHIKSFQNNDEFLPHTYTDKWVEEFRKYFLNIGLNDNSIAKYRAALKTFIKHFKSKGFNIPVNPQNIIVKEREQVVVTLLEDELEALEDLKLDDANHDKVRDVFLFQCYTGARFGNVNRINKYYVKGDRWEYISIKTNQEISAPLFNKSNAILQKYKDFETPLPTFTNQYINEKIKDIAKLAKLDRIVKLVKHYDNVLKEDWLKLHEIISTHCARKTYITLTLGKGVPERMVREVSGHKDERSFRRYVNYNKKHLEIIKKVWES